ncbi:uncharacterized protein LOC131638428 [Vicia villosa]|uniref:uncharacterized protein LOC131638428 n=1 Tax=Vicia villosa TaxID=3911 RepID=UPI00273AB4CE|nr:uncharacterized protein LOC131638428 [Vicia villosa]
MAQPLTNANIRSCIKKEFKLSEEEFDANHINVRALYASQGLEKDVNMYAKEEVITTKNKLVRCTMRFQTIDDDDEHVHDAFLHYMSNIISLPITAAMSNSSSHSYCINGLSPTTTTTTTTTAATITTTTTTATTSTTTIAATATTTATASTTTTDTTATTTTTATTATTITDTTATATTTKKC